MLISLHTIQFWITDPENSMAKLNIILYIMILFSLSIAATTSRKKQKNHTSASG